MRHLPMSSAVDTDALELSLSRTTNSYKFLFLSALVDLLEWNAFDHHKLSVTLHDIATEMLILAWYPHIKLGLSLGKQDKIGEILDALTVLANTSSQTGLADYLHKGVRIGYPLEKYVPYRLLRGFFDSELRGLPDAKINAMIDRLATEHFDTRRPLYRFISGSILVHPSWAEYLKLNTKEVREWLYGCFVDYLESRNPGRTAIGLELQPYKKRDGIHISSEQYAVAKKTIALMTEPREEARQVEGDDFLAGFIQQMWDSYSVPKDKAGL